MKLDLLLFIVSIYFVNFAIIVNLTGGCTVCMGQATVECLRPNCVVTYLHSPKLFSAEDLRFNWSTGYFRHRHAMVILFFSRFLRQLLDDRKPHRNCSESLQDPSENRNRMSVRGTQTLSTCGE